MLKLCLTLSAAFVLQGSSACEDMSREQNSSFRKFIPDNWNDGESFNYQPNLVVPEYAGRYEWQTPALNNHGSAFVNPFLEYYYNGEKNQNRFPSIYGVNSYEEETRLEGRVKKPLSSINSLKKYFVNKDVVVEEDQAKSENRFILGNGIFNNQLRPAGNMLGFLFNLANRIPISIIPNSGRPFDACTTRNGDTGICASGSVCSLFGGRPSGSCFLGNICCVNAVNQCGGTVTLNNTYWQSPAVAIKSPTICALNIKLDTNFVEQLMKPICQIRLDFVSFNIAQPTAGTCTDSFQVGGTTTVAPIICGDNSGQHMYLDVPSSDVTPTDVQLMFNFAIAGTATPNSRSWNIKIALLPCDADNLAPVDCLQYFTAPTGRVSSFNWRDVPVSAIRQLNNQNYNICFRTELVDRQKATQICLSVCATSNAGAGYSITTNAVNAGNSLLGVGNSANGYCTYDFLAIVGATDLSTGLVGDRFCGEKLNTARAPGVAVNGQLCTKIKPFKLIYGTDGTEAEVGPPALVSTPADTNNVGFCLDYQERVN